MRELLIRFFGITKEAVFSSNQWTALVGLVKNHRATAEYVEAPAIAHELKTCDEPLNSICYRFKK